METPETAQAGIEHVERSGDGSAVDNVDVAVDRLPPPRRTTRASSGRPRPLSMPPVSTSDGPATQQASDHANHGQEHRSQTHQSSRRGTSRPTVRVIGNYSLGKTLGAGSMGKVKLAYHNVTGEKLAIKIVPRPTGNHSNTGNPTASFLARQAAKDASKEIRTVREAALSMILFHPYICGTREIIAQPNYHYIVFEFVNGGQMLDYIISHGRLRERVARKFARQIGSALEYCHKNNVVHRDLKIENILISESGNIKIIDFGLSNLYNPASHLSTFCGSLYFAAPELLNAKVYTGPEVDIWSFGVVLYVLVCGKVPFDDQHMPALHAKIKRGLVDYPNWLSAECKHILSRMLVVIPSQRASLTEILNHPWMLRGFSGPPDPHLLPREPLRSSDIDPNVIRGMTGFEFGTAAEIEQKLRAVLESETYKRMVSIFERRRDPTRTNGLRDSSPSSSLTAINSLAQSPTADSFTRKSSKRFSGFDFYRRKFFSQGNSPPSTPTNKPQMTALYGPQSAAIMDSSRPGDYIDPTLGFHPLVSIYFLVREKMERERVYGPQFASSQISLNPPHPTVPHQDAAVSLETPTAPVPPPSSFKGTSPTIAPPKPVAVPGGPLSASYQKPDYNMPLPRLPAPEPSHQAGTAYDSPVPKSPTSPNHPQSRTIATDLPVTVHREKDPTSQSPPSAYAGMPAAPKPAEKHQHRRSTSLTNRASLMPGWVGHKASTPSRTGAADQPALDEKAETETRPSKEHQEDGRVSPLSSTSPPHPSGSSIRRITNMIGNRLSEDTRKTLGRRGSLLRGAFSLPRHSVDVTSQEKDGDRGSKAGAAPVTHKSHEQVTALEQTQSVPMPSSQSQPASNLHRRAATIVDHQGREGRHIRRGSLGAGFALNAFGTTIGRRPKTGTSAAASKQMEPKTDVDEEKSNGMEGEGVLISKEETAAEVPEDDGSATERDVKPLYLKGLFSVATTSTRPANVIKTDIRNVLDRMQINYREIRGGFECIHAPSIDLNSVNIESIARSSNIGSRQGSSIHNDTSAASTMRRGVVRKASKLTFATVRRKDKGKEVEAPIQSPMTPSATVAPSVVVSKGDDKDLPQRPSVSTVGAVTQPLGPESAKIVSPSGGSSSFFNVPSPSNQPATGDADETVNGHDAHGRETSQEKGDAPSIHTEVEGSHQDSDLPPDLAAATTPVAAEIIIEQPSPTKSASVTPTRDKFLPPIPRDFGAQTPTTPTTPTPKMNGQQAAVDDLFENSGTSDLIVRFEIMIVKVPLLPLHGIQFRRIGGDGWQYHMLARRVLTELKL
ncbi:serine/threonine-protein kinase KIN2 [Serendipita sp. 399]|nr:serine/threonine-protein kinase KIN2 [Serendipita sp. 399]